MRYRDIHSRNRGEKKPRYFKRDFKLFSSHCCCNKTGYLMQHQNIFQLWLCRLNWIFLRRWDIFTAISLATKLHVFKKTSRHFCRGSGWQNRIVLTRCCATFSCFSGNKKDIMNVPLLFVAPKQIILNSRRWHICSCGRTNTARHFWQDVRTLPAVFLATKPGILSQRISFPNPNKVVFVPKPNETEKNSIFKTYDWNVNLKKKLQHV